MRLSRLKIAALVLFAGLGWGFAIAQTTIVATTFSGNEVVRMSQGPGGQEAFYQINNIRGSEPIITQSGSGAATATAPATGGTLCWKGTAPTTWAVTLPAAPAAGTYVRLCADTTMTTMVTVTAGSGDTLTTTFNSQTLTANASFPQWQYNATDKVWYRIQ